MQPKHLHVMNAACMLDIKHAETFFLKEWTRLLNHYDLVVLRGSLFRIDLLTLLVHQRAETNKLLPWVNMYLFRFSKSSL